jgi:putative intracellular protease/amidase
MKTIGALVFPEFELLDMYGPLEMFGLLRDDVEIRMVAETREPVRSSPGPKTVVDDLISDSDDYDILIVPGGRGSRREVENNAVLDWLRAAASKAKLVTSVCTGSATLAKASLLNGRRATTNKAAYEWVRAQGPDALWQPQARWVEDGYIRRIGRHRHGPCCHIAALWRGESRSYCSQRRIRMAP